MRDLGGTARFGQKTVIWWMTFRPAGLDQAVVVDIIGSQRDCAKSSQTPWLTRRKIVDTAQVLPP
jgi:hypothetical protein